MLDLALLNPLPLAIAMVGIVLAFANARGTRCVRPVPVPTRGKVGPKRV